MQWENGGGEGLRLASTAPVPWTSSNVALVCVARDGTVHTVHTVTGKRQMLEGVAREDMILACWPGQRRQDVFIVDDRRAALRAVSARR